MDICYSDDLIGTDHIHTDITTCNTEESHLKYALERPVKDYWGRVHCIFFHLLGYNLFA